MGRSNTKRKGTMNSRDGQAIIQERRRELAWAIRDHLNPNTLTALQARNFEVHDDMAPVLTATVNLRPIDHPDIPAIDMTIAITYLEGIEEFDVLTYYYSDSIYMGQDQGIGVPVGTLDEFLLTLTRRGSDIQRFTL